MMHPEVSCLNCPSYLEPIDAAKFFGKSIGAPTCARYGKALGIVNSTGADITKISKQIARNCPSYNEPAPKTPDWQQVSIDVAIPDLSAANAVPNQPELVTTCATCVNYVRPDVVLNELGWTSGMCSAKGKLLLGNRLSYEAKNCELRSFGNIRTDISSIMMLPEYTPELVVTGDPVKNYFNDKKSAFIDPVDYPTDKPVTPDEEAAGIRAWRVVHDPITENEVYLPIYRVDFFDDNEQKKIPRTGNDEHPEDYVDHNFYTYRTAVLWTELDETPGIWGQPGTGKTEFFRHMAWLMCLPFERVSITASTELEDLAGKMHFSKEKGTYFTYGRLSLAWSKPCVLVVDEPNVGPPDVWQFLRPMIDNSKQLVLDMNNGEGLDRHTDCYLGMAMNPAWDSKNVGAQMISDADVNRLMHMYIELPPEKLEREIIKTRCTHDGYGISNDTLDTIMKIAKDIRALCDQDTLPITWAIRPQLKVARASRWFDLKTAYRMASADFLEPEQQTQLLDVVRAHVPEG